MRGRVHAKRTSKGLVADLRFYKDIYKHRGYAYNKEISWLRHYNHVLDMTSKGARNGKVVLKM